MSLRLFVTYAKKACEPACVCVLSQLTSFFSQRNTHTINAQQILADQPAGFFFFDPKPVSEFNMENRCL